MSWIKRHGHWILTLFVAFVFIQSLFFKFSGSPETIYIFQGKLDPWAASLGFPGTFAPGGIFSAKVVGAFELIASLLLLVGAALSQRRAIQVRSPREPRKPAAASRTRSRASSTTSAASSASRSMVRAARGRWPPTWARDPTGPRG